MNKVNEWFEATCKIGAEQTKGAGRIVRYDM
jgi:hypothetical protein